MKWQLHNGMPTQLLHRKCSLHTKLYTLHKKQYTLHTPRVYPIFCHCHPKYELFSPVTIFFHRCHNYSHNLSKIAVVVIKKHLTPRRKFSKKLFYRSWWLHSNLPPYLNSCNCALFTICIPLTILPFTYRVSCEAVFPLALCTCPKRWRCGLTHSTRLSNDVLP